MNVFTVKQQYVVDQLRAGRTIIRTEENTFIFSDDGEKIHARIVNSLLDCKYLYTNDGVAYNLSQRSFEFMRP